MDIQEAFSKSFDDDWLDTLEKYLLGGDINAHHPTTGWTLLHLAAEMERLDVIKWLIERGANINAVDHQGLTPLHLAVDIDIDGAIQNREEISMATSSLLIKLGADETIKDNNRDTARDIANAYHLVELYDAIERS